MGERTGSRVFQWVWSYVIIPLLNKTYNPLPQAMVRVRAKTKKPLVNGPTLNKCK
ncbi:hypothetical protein CTRU02_205883 [Colletotrichum truncatum]|uniref:Uncharacterized protein n=1 Tax=Colletotrichum truncatum TaxID=5467 RepID=A0ACC3Z5A1_COLTU